MTPIAPQEEPVVEPEIVTDPTRSIDTTPSIEDQSIYAIDKGNSDYHQGFDLQPNTIYFWKVVGKDVNNPGEIYTSSVYQFTTENY